MKKIFTLADTNPMGYEEFGKAINGLISKLETFIREKHVHFDLIVPILRSGAIPASIIAIRFKITKILPLQLKYVHSPKVKIKKLLSMPRILQKIPKNPNILLCENNTVSGETAKMAVKILKNKFPNGKIYYATVAKVFGGPDKIEDTEGYFYGILTDENCIANSLQLKKLNLRRGITIYPWENAKNELADINAS